MLRTVVAVSAAAITALAGLASAHAQPRDDAHDGARLEARREPTAPPPQDAPSERPPGLDGHWSHGEPRPFVSGRVDAGVPYVKPQVAVGYGKPHDTFVAVEAFGITTNTFGAGYVGARFELPFLWVTAGGRYTSSYVRSFLDPRASFTAADVEARNGKDARYWAFDVDVGGYLPAPRGAIIWNALATGVAGAPGAFLFEESARAVIAAPWVFTGRLGYVALVGPKGVGKVGVLGELIHVPGRDAQIGRVGPIVSVKLTDHLDALAALTLVVSSPDRLGPTLGAWGVGGLRWSWATGDRGLTFL